MAIHQSRFIETPLNRTLVGIIPGWSALLKMEDSAGIIPQ